MRISRLLLGVAVAAAAIAGAVAIAARYSDGPLGPFPGGRLVAGDIMDDTSDWSFAEPAAEIELQLFDPDGSRRVWILVRDGAAYIPCGWPNVMFKQWPHQAMEDPRALVRIEGNRYVVDLERVEDPDLTGELGLLLEAKYEAGFDGEVWYFQLVEAAPD